VLADRINHDGTTSTTIGKLIGQDQKDAQDLQDQFISFLFLSILFIL